jgi:hypothetical protein
MARKKKKVSKKKTSKSKAVATRKSTLPANWKDQLREDAAEESERTPLGSGNRISLKRNGQFSFQGADLGDSIDLVIVDHVALKAYYDVDYDEDNPVPPACFALKPNAKNISPHENSPDVQAEICSECWANEWASGRGRGKACSDKNRLACLHVDDLEGDLIYMEVPVTSGASFNKYITGLTKVAELPCYAIITRFEMDDHADYQKLIFTYIEEVPENQLGGPFNQRKAAREMLMEPFDVSGYEESGGKKSKKKKKKTKKKVSKKSGKKKTARKKRRSRMS